MPARRFLSLFLAVYAAAFVLVHLTPEHIHRRNLDKAFSAWLHDRTPQNEVTLGVEQRKNERIELADSALIAGALVTVGSGIYFVIRFTHKKIVRRRSETDTPLV